jgi:hypothetical protein
MAFVLPTFNLTMDVWTSPANPFGGAASFLNVPCQIYNWSKVLPGAPPFAQIRFPIDFVNTYTVGDVIEAPSGSTRYWLVLSLYRQHEGFANEFWNAEVVTCDNVGVQAFRGLP